MSPDAGPMAARPNGLAPGSLVRLVWRLAQAAVVVAVIALVLWNTVLVAVMVTQLHMNDFGRFYYSTAAFLRGEEMYGPSPATLIPVTRDRAKHFWNMNPPHFHLILVPLTLLPAGQALALWGGASVAALAVSLRLIGGQARLGWGFWGRPLSLVALLGFAGTGAVCITGQQSLLLMLPLTLAWIHARHERWPRAALYLGPAMAVKPFLLIFVPYMALLGERRAAALAVASGAACFAVGLPVFGVATYRSWLQVLNTADWAWAAMNGSILGLLTRAFDESPYYAPLAVVPALVQPAWLLLAGTVGVLTLAVSVSDRTEATVDRGFALLLVGAQLISPLGWVYYLWLALGPLAALAPAWWRGDGRGGISAWRRGLALLAVIPFLSPLPAVTFGQPSGWATITLGSAYFWGMLAVWLTVLTTAHPLSSSPTPG